MKTRKKRLLLPLVLVSVLLLLAAVHFLLPRCIPTEWFGFGREVPKDEQELRMTLVDTACSWAGAREGDAHHRAIIDLYNTLDPLPQEYRVTYDDAWCAAFVTAAAMESGLTDIIPPECSCARQIKAFRDLGCWEEDDAYAPLPGDIIYYDWDFSAATDCTGWPEHVGIVVGTFGPFIRVMEGNKQGEAAYRTIRHNDWCIRGYGLPDYASNCK